MEWATAIQRLKERSTRRWARREVSATRSLDFSQWVRDFARPSGRGFTVDGVEVGCFWVSDVDFMVYDKERAVFQLIEVKSGGKGLDDWQRSMFGLLDRIIQVGIDHDTFGVRYLGFHTVVFSSTTPDNSSWIKWDGEVVTKDRFYELFNMMETVT